MSLDYTDRSVYNVQEIVALSTMILSLSLYLSLYLTLTHTHTHPYEENAYILSAEA